MVVALIWAVALVVLGIYAIRRVDAFMRDKKGLPNLTGRGVSLKERLAALKVRQDTHDDEVRLRKLQLQREIAEQQALLDHKHDLAAQQTELEKARLQGRAATEVDEAQLGLDRQRIDFLVAAHKKHYNACGSTALRFNDFVAVFNRPRE